MLELCRRWAARRLANPCGMHARWFGLVVLASGIAASTIFITPAARSAEPVSPAAGKPVEGPLTFERHIRPILKAYCLDCHGGGELKGGLDLRLARFLLKGGEGGAAVLPGQPDASLLVHRIRDGEMPPGEKKLPAAELETIRRWIADGAKTARPEPEMLDEGIGITPEEREFWAFQPLQRPATPALSAADAARQRTPIDAFILAKAAQQQLPLAVDADRATLLRRAALDLTGLPPTQEEIESFVADPSPDAYQRQLDRLLASPRYGERWGRHWLDVAGYADSDGYTNADSPRPYAYKYRDYVIQAFNEDLPLDRFLLEQLAGDELVGEVTTNFTPEQIRWLTATGFLRMAADGTGSGAPDQDLARNQVMADTLRIVSTTFLGLSVHCAQCHNHRYDPIPQTDYYRLRAVFEPALDWKNWRPPQQRLVSLYTDADRAKAAEVEAEVQKIAAEKNGKQSQYLQAALEKELQKFPEPQRPTLRAAYETPADKRTPEQNQLLKENPSVNISPGVLYQYDAAAAEDLKKYDQRIEETRRRKPVEDFVHALVERNATTPTTFLFHRGDHRQPKDAVNPGDLTIAAPVGQRFDIAAKPTPAPNSGRRAAFAQHLTRGDHPLFGRVMANRLWMHHFGRGIVGTAGDFGALGDRPTHPELLDWLAVEWPARGWSWKEMHRTLMSSTTFQLASTNPASMAMDQDNRWFTRAGVRRLEAETLRDRLLFASGALSSRMGGPAIAVKEDDVGQVIVTPGEARRSVYVQQRRSQPVAFLSSFDAPVMETNCDRRTTSTVATQSLMLMNSDFVREQAAELARRARHDAETMASPKRPAEIEQLAARVEQLRRTPAWIIGYGKVDEAAQRVSMFERLPHWTGSSWQGGPQLPDAQLGWVLQHANGGHPGGQFATIRRWTAPRAGKVSLKGGLSHGSPNGDGVRARVISSRSGKLGEWLAKSNSVETTVADATVEAGEVLDFVVDARESETSDSYGWTATVTLQASAAGETPAATLTFVAEKEFPGPRPAPAVRALERAWQLALGRNASDAELALALELVARQAPALHATTGESVAAETEAIVNVCQALLTSNEFLYVD
ncbi:MAG: PSD1 and planctomycete cytochrome C domain-containing protein [Pirellulales bacterium]